MLAADAELDLGIDAARPLDGEAHEVADAAYVQRLERVRSEDAVFEVVRQELALGVVAGEAERRLGQVVRAEAEEVGLCCDLVCADACARELDHRPHLVVELARGLLELGGGSVQRRVGAADVAPRRSRRAGA